MQCLFRQKEDLALPLANYFVEREDGYVTTMRSAPEERAWKDDNPRVPHGSQVHVVESSACGLFARVEGEHSGWIKTKHLRLVPGFFLVQRSDGYITTLRERPDESSDWMLNNPRVASGSCVKVIDTTANGFGFVEGDVKGWIKIKYLRTELAQRTHLEIAGAELAARLSELAEKVRKETTSVSAVDISTRESESIAQQLLAAAEKVRQAAEATAPYAAAVAKPAAITAGEVAKNSAVVALSRAAAIIRDDQTTTTGAACLALVTLRRVGGLTASCVLSPCVQSSAATLSKNTRTSRSSFASSVYSVAQSLAARSVPEHVDSIARSVSEHFDAVTRTMRHDPSDQCPNSEERRADEGVLLAIAQNMYAMGYTDSEVIEMRQIVCEAKLRNSSAAEDYLTYTQAIRSSCISADASGVPVNQNSLMNMQALHHSSNTVTDLG